MRLYWMARATYQVLLFHLQEIQNLRLKEKKDATEIINYLSIKYATHMFECNPENVLDVNKPGHGPR